MVNIGIGGSFLGPELVSEALLSYAHKGVRCHYLANIDGSEFHELTMKLRAETTLYFLGQAYQQVAGFAGDQVFRVIEEKSAAAQGELGKGRCTPHCVARWVTSCRSTA